MNLKRKRWLFLIVVLAVGCAKEDDPATRSFHLGFTPFPYAISSDAVEYVYDKIAIHGDIINHHFDNGVPWVEAFEGKPFHENMMADWEFRKARTPEDLNVYVSVTPLNEMRTGLASYRGEEDHMILPEPWASYSFTDEPVRQAYLAYCKRAIDFFEPDYFAMAIEANLFYASTPGQWTAYYDFHRYIYKELKAAYPELPVFTSIAGAYLMPGFIDHNDHLLQRLATLQLMDYSDYYGISFYPYLSTYAGNPYPEGTIRELFSISEKPVVISETGYAAETFSVTLEGQPTITIESDEIRQQTYFRDLLNACSERDVKFVINFTLRDYDELWKEIGSPAGLEIAWRDTGLYNEVGQPRPALTTWSEALSRIYKP